MREFFKAFVYFVENGLPEKLAKDLAEKVTGITAPTGKIKIPEKQSKKLNYQKQNKMFLKQMKMCQGTMHKVIENIMQMF